MTGDQGTQTSHLAKHGAPLHAVGPNGAAIDSRGGWLQPRDSNGYTDQHHNRNTGPQDLPAALLALQFRTSDIHYAFIGATGEPFSVSVSWCVLSRLSQSHDFWDERLCPSPDCNVQFRTVQSGYPSATAKLRKRAAFKLQLIATQASPLSDRKSTRLNSSHL